jgi:hypothetical protein
MVAGSRPTVMNLGGAWSRRALLFLLVITLHRVFTSAYLKRNMLLGYTVLQLYSVAAIQCCSYTALQLYSVASIQCCSYTVLQLYSVAAIQGCRYTVLQLYSVAAIQCCRYTVLQLYTVAAIQCCSCCAFTIMTHVMLLSTTNVLYFYLVLSE